MNELDQKSQDYQSLLDKKVQELDKTDEVLRKKLVKKIYFIVFSMIVTLVTIIIVEFKELTFNSVVEYKIGKNDLGPKDLVWAGIMGTPPSYYESDKKYGLGIKEFETKEIRVAIQEAGYNIIYRYMSPNRLEFEFTRKHPLCFYDRKWSNPKEYFKKERPEILSLALNYSGREPKKIIFRKEDRDKFKKHLDQKGDLVLESLIKDTSLKTELIRAVNYDGPYAREKITYGKKQLDGTYYDIIKDKFAKNIDLVILHTNDQILQMLGKKRFDYQFLDTLEYDEYIWIHGGKNRIDSIMYDSKSIKSTEDPGLIFHSVACGNHPLTKKIMPIINNVIKQNRNDDRKFDTIVKYAKKLNPDTFLQKYDFSLTTSISGKNKPNLGDGWFERQFTNFGKTSWPLFNVYLKNGSFQDLKKLEEKYSQYSSLNWNLIEKKTKNGEKTLLVIHDTDIKNKEEENILNNSFLESKNNHETRKILDKKQNFQNLNFSSIEHPENIIIFAKGIKDLDIPYLKKIYSAKSLKGITLIDGSIYHGREMLKTLPKDLEILRFFDVPLLETLLGPTLKRMEKLKVLAIHASKKHPANRLFVTNTELLSIVKNLPKELEYLSLVENFPPFIRPGWFPDDFYEIFVQKKLTKLKFLQLTNFTLDEGLCKLLLGALPLELESLIIGSELSSGSISTMLIEDFLNKRYHINALKLLRINRLTFSLNKNNKLKLPKSLKDLSLTWANGSLESNFDRIIFHPKMQLKNLDLSENDLTDSTLQKIFPFLDPNIENLYLSKNKITGRIFSFYAKKYKNKLNDSKSIHHLKLDSNPIDDIGFVYFSQLSWKIKTLDISNLKITDNSFNIFSSKKLENLMEIDLSENYISKKYINKFLSLHFNKLITLKLRNMLSIDTKNLAENMPQTLEYLDLNNNLLTDHKLYSWHPFYQKILDSLIFQTQEWGHFPLIR